MAHIETVLGSPVTIRYELFRDGALADPDRLALIVRSYDSVSVPVAEWPGGTDIVRDSAGMFHAEVVPSARGQYVYRWEAYDDADEPIGAAEGEFIVRSLFR